MVESRLVGGIAIFEDLGRIQGLCIGIEAGIDPVGSDPLGEGLAVRGIHRRHLSPRGQGKQQQEATAASKSQVGHAAF